MNDRLSQIAKAAVFVGVLVAAGSAIAATNWHSTWVAFTLDSGAVQTAVANQAQATFQQWVLVWMASLFVTMTGLAWLMLAQTGQKHRYPIPAG